MIDSQCFNLLLFHHDTVGLRLDLRQSILQLTRRRREVLIFQEELFAFTEDAVQLFFDLLLFDIQRLKTQCFK